MTIVRVPLEIGFGAAKGAVKFAQGLVGGGEEPVAEKPRPASPPRRRRTSSRSRAARSGNGRARTGTAAKRRAGSPAEEAMKAAPPVDLPASTTAAEARAPVADEAATAVAGEPGPAVAPASAAGEPASVADEPTHVSEEPELVAEAAEAGAEEGAGAEVTVEEPWPGYDEMNAPDIEDRLVTEGPETAAAVSLYEASSKGRTSVIEAASRTMAR